MLLSSQQRKPLIFVWLSPQEMENRQNGTGFQPVAINQHISNQISYTPIEVTRRG
jgi:hypothetical protein